MVSNWFDSKLIREQRQTIISIIKIQISFAPAKLTNNFDKVDDRKVEFYNPYCSLNIFYTIQNLCPYRSKSRIAPQK